MQTGYGFSFFLPSITLSLSFSRSLSLPRLFFPLFRCMNCKYLQELCEYERNWLCVCVCVMVSNPGLPGIKDKFPQHFDQLGLYLYLSCQTAQINIPVCWHCTTHVYFGRRFYFYFFYLFCVLSEVFIVCIVYVCIFAVLFSYFPLIYYV